MNKLLIISVLMTCSFSSFSSVTYSMEQLREKINNSQRPEVLLPVKIDEASNFINLESCHNWLANKIQLYKGYPYVVDIEGRSDQYNVKIYTESKRYTFDCTIAPNINAIVYEAEYQG